jgi:hypothetical protein
MNRRDFLSSFGLGAAGLVAGAEFDWDRLLWTPKPIITVPALAGRGVVRVPIGDRVFVFRNVDVAHPRDLVIPADDWHPREVPGVVQIDADVQAGHRVIPVKHMERYDTFGGTLYAGNTITFSWEGRSLLTVTNA